MPAINMADAMRIRVVPLPLPHEWRRFLGDLPRLQQWTMFVYGPPFGGKSSFLLKFSRVLAYYGKVLYVNAEENTKGGTIQNKARLLQILSDKIYFLDDDTLESIREELGAGEYQYCVIDSISEMANTMNETLGIIDIRKEFPDISFIFISHADKSEKTYLGPSKLKHKVDIALLVEDSVVYTEKNRYKRNKSDMMFNIFGKQNYGKSMDKTTTYAQKRFPKPAKARTGRGIRQDGPKAQTLQANKDRRPQGFAREVP